MQDLNTEIVEVNASMIDNLFNETPSGTPTADSLIAAKENKEEPVIKQTEDPSIQKLQDRDIDSLFDETEDGEEEPIKEEKKEEKKEVKEKPAKKEEPAKAKEDISKDTGTGLNYKEIYQYYVESGKWLPLEEETLEQMEWNEDTFQQLWDSQWDAQVSSGVEELIDSTGPYGKAIISYVNNGGNPEEIIDLFKEQKKLESIDINNELGQKQMISGYYKELGWSDQKISKHIQRLEAEGDEALQSEAAEVKSLHEDVIKSKVESKNKDQEEFAKEQVKREQAFKNNIINTLKDRKDLTAQKKQEIHKALLNYDQKLPNGNTVNSFYIKFQEFIADPNNYIDLYDFISDKEKFFEKIDKKAETKATLKNFRFIKNGGALSNKGGALPEKEKESKEDFKFNYRLF